MVYSNTITGRVDWRSFKNVVELHCLDFQNKLIHIINKGECDIVFKIIPYLTEDLMHKTEIESGCLLPKEELTFISRNPYFKIIVQFAASYDRSSEYLIVCNMN